MKKKLYVAMAVLGTVGLMACGDDAATGTGTLNKAQTQAVLGAANQAVFEAYGSAGRLAIRAATYSADASADCDGGGTVAVSGDFSSADAGATFTYDVDATFNDCAVTGSDGKSYTITGSLSPSGEGTFDEGSGDFSLTSSYSGTISVTGDVEVTDCSWDISSDLSVSGSDFSGEWSGTVCGNDISGDYSGSV